MKSSTLMIEDLAIEIYRKNVKNLNLRIYPPDGRVSLSAPHSLSEEMLRLFLQRKIEWIRRKQAEVRQQAQGQKATLDQFKEVEILGKKIRVKEGEPRKNYHIEKIDNGLAVIVIGKGNSNADLVRVYEQLAREILEQLIPSFVAKWQQVLGVQVREVRIRKMKTRWGSCNPQARRIWLNAELAKKPLECVEYVIVHEMVHFLEQRHNDRFYRLMDETLPDWRARRAQLKGSL
jgi:predicted metal-dependent hydrolase